MKKKDDEGFSSAEFAELSAVTQMAQDLNRSGDYIALEILAAKYGLVYTPSTNEFHQDSTRIGAESPSSVIPLIKIPDKQKYM